MDIPVIYEDKDLLVILKPAGLVVTPAESIKVQTLADILLSDFGINLERGGVVHRLDKDTSGIMLVAKTQETLENLQFQFKERLIKKEYQALVHGVLQEQKTVTGAIGRNPGNREKFTILEDGKEAETDFKPIIDLTLPITEFPQVFEGFNRIQLRKLERMGYDKYTLVACFPKTGRTHQIRVHLKYLNLPIVTDEKYGGKKVVRLDKRWCPRMFLHAKKIIFYHPFSGEKMEFESPLPEDLTKALKFLHG